MKVYLAGTTGIISREKQLRKFYKSRLLSYWDVAIVTHRAGKESFELFIKKLQK